MSFDPDAFMNQSTAEAGSTAFEPIPAGEYPALINDVVIRSFARKDGTDGLVCDVTYLLQSPDVAKKLGREQLTIRQGIFLDTKDGKLDMSKGKNIGLNKVRDALGMNVPGKPFSPAMLKGAGPLKVNVTLRPDKNSDAIYNDVRSVGKM